MTTTNIRIGIDGDRVILEFEGKILRLPWKAADEIAHSLIIKARQVEEVEKVNPIAKDDAILLRLGIPLGLTNHPNIRAEAEKLAQYDPELRKAIPGGIQSEVHFGTPTIIKGEPRA